MSTPPHFDHLVEQDRLTKFYQLKLEAIDALLADLKNVGNAGNRLIVKSTAGTDCSVPLVHTTKKARSEPSATFSKRLTGLRRSPDASRTF